MEQPDRSRDAVRRTRSPRHQPAFVTKLNDNDVLLGRGQPSINYIGNRKFRDLVRTRKREYAQATRNVEKNTIARQIIHEVQLRRGGRFLQRIDNPQEARKLGVPDSVNNAWKIAEESVTMEKCKQTLRDKDPPPSRSAATSSQTNSTVSGTDRSSAGKLSTQVLPGAVTDQATTLAHQLSTLHGLQQTGISTGFMSNSSGREGTGSANIPTVGTDSIFGISGGVPPQGASSAFYPQLNIEAMRNLQQQAAVSLMGQQYPCFQPQNPRLQLQQELVRLQRDRLLQTLSRTGQAYPVPAATSTLQLDRATSAQFVHPTNINFDWQSGRRSPVARSTINSNLHLGLFGDSSAGLYPFNHTAFSSASLPGFSAPFNAVNPFIRNYAAVASNAIPLSIANETIRRNLLLEQLAQRLPTTGTANDHVSAGPLQDQWLSGIPMASNQSTGTDGRFRGFPVPPADDEEAKSTTTPGRAKRARHSE